MLDRDDEQFEARLKKFRPLAAEPLPMERSVGARRRTSALAVCVSVVVMMVVAAVIARQRAIQFSAIHRKVKVVDAVKVMPPAGGRPLTIRSANELLAHAPSVKSALDELAFHGRAEQFPEGTQSALAVLGKEDLKP
ncbi:MAG: hypothetical protein EPN47_12020 [Acidobacteria bacterium]|nr:MAG: hypothetical protein EPN47_12020 [Acidobacteriota bacterium]